MKNKSNKQSPKIHHSQSPLRLLGPTSQTLFKGRADVIRSSKMTTADSNQKSKKLANLLNITKETYLSSQSTKNPQNDLSNTNSLSEKTNDFVIDSFYVPIKATSPSNFSLTQKNVKEKTVEAKLLRDNETNCKSQRYKEERTCLYAIAAIIFY